MYSINNIAFSAFGITPGRITGSNISLSGMLDMPARIGKVYHDWTDEPGVEPYVSAADIRHGGRTIEFAGFMQGEDKANVYGMLETFYKELSGYTQLVPLETPWSTHQVYIKQEITAEYLQEGWLKLNCKFEEPVVPNPAQLPVGAQTTKPNIDGVALERLGIFLNSIKDHLNRPRTKNEQFTAYSTQGYQVTPPEALEFELELIAYAGSYELLSQNIKSLQKLISAPGMRKLQVDQQTREVFNIKGFQVSDLKISNEMALCRITLPLMASKMGAPVKLLVLADNEYNKIVGNLNKLIKLNSWTN